MKEKDIIPEPVEPGGVHPELGGQVDSQRKGAVHGVVEESPAHREEKSEEEEWSVVSNHHLISALHFLLIKYCSR